MIRRSPPRLSGKALSRRQEIAAAARSAYRAKVAAEALRDFVNDQEARLRSPLLTRGAVLRINADLMAGRGIVPKAP